MGTFMLLLDVTIVNVALPSIQTSLKANFSDLQWVVDAYSLMLAALLLTTGSFADLWGRRLIFVLGLVVFTGSSLASGLAQSPLWLNLARGAQGVGASAMFSTGLALLGSSFQGRERGVAFGVWGAITGLAVAVGPVVGGGLTTGISWRWIFLVNVPIGVIAVIICLLRVDESKMPHARKPDPIGVLTFSGALAALVYALIKGDQKGWGAEVIQACLIGAAGLLVVFLIAERLQRDRAMFDLSLFRKPTFTGGAIAAFGLSGGLFALFLYLTLYLQDILGYSALQTGLRFIVLSGGMLLTSFVSGRLTAVVPIRLLISPGLAMVAVGLFLMRGITVSTAWTHLIPGFIIAGAGTGLINPPLASTAIGVVRPERAGMASGINSTFRQVGIATGIAGLGAIFSHRVRTSIESLLHGSSQVSAAQTHALASSVASGSGARAGIAALPDAARATAAHALKASFAAGLNELFLVGAILSLSSAVLTLILIRSKDFEVGAARTVARPAEQPPSETQPASGDSQAAAVQAGAEALRPAEAAADPAAPGGEVAAMEAPDGHVEVGEQAVQPSADPEVDAPSSVAAADVEVAEPATQLASAPPPSADGSEGAHNGSQVQVDARSADIESVKHSGQEATQVSEASHISAEEEPANDGLHQRMSGYGYQSPLPPPPPPPSLVPPATGLGSGAPQSSAEAAGPAQAPSGPVPGRLRGYQKPSQAWLAASQAWRTRAETQASDAEPPPTDVQETGWDSEQAQSNVEPFRTDLHETASDVGPTYADPSDQEDSSSDVEETFSSPEQASWNVEDMRSDAERTTSNGEQLPSDTDQVPSDIEGIRLEIERTKSRVEEIASGVGSLGTGDSRAEAAARLRSAPASRSFWSRFSGSSPSQASAVPESTTAEPTSPETDPEPAGSEAETSQPEAEVSALDTTDLQSESEVTETEAAESQPEPEFGAVDVVESQPEPEFGAVDVVESQPEPEASAVDAVTVAQAGSAELDPGETMTEAEPVTDGPDFGTVGQDSEPLDQPAPAWAAPSESAPDLHSDHPSDQDVPMSKPPLGPPSEPEPAPAAFTPAPAMRDVRLVVQAVQSAEEAALAYAREIGEARRHLSEAIAHLDRADDARALLNRFAAGFSGPATGASGSAGSSDTGAPQDQGAGGAPTGTSRVGSSISTPSPGIAIASPSGPAPGSRTGPTDEAYHRAGTSDPAADGTPAHEDGSGGAGDSASGYGFGSRSQIGSMPNPPSPPPPRPGGWGGGGGNS